MHPRLTVIGTGYLGVTHAACMSELGFDVLALDIDSDKVARLQSGESPIFEPDLEPMLRRGLAAGRLHFTTSPAQVAAFGDVHFLCLGTPQAPGSYAADLGQIDAAVGVLAPLLERPCLVVGKSTVPVGTAAGLAARLAALAPAGSDVRLAWNPEFLREGYAVADTLRPDRIVVGTADGTDEPLLREVYAGQLAAGVPYQVTDYPTAELVKTAANAFLATKISFINAMAEVCEASGADVSQLARAISYDERIGAKSLRPGLGFGGGCLPKDIRAFMARADELGVGPSLNFLREIDAINARRRTRMVDLARDLLGGSLTGRMVAVLGAAFKPGSDDIRDSPALDVATRLHAEGAKVTVYDPAALDNARRARPELGYADSVLDAATGAEAVLLLTEWDEFRELDPRELAEAVSVRGIVDGRAALDPARWREAGWRYLSLGRP